MTCREPTGTSRPHGTIAQKILCEMADAVARDDQEAAYDLLDLTLRIVEPDERAAALNQLLVMPGHRLHQAITRQIQALRCPSSVAFIRQVLDGGLHMFDYTCSEPGVIAKWFSHALADIGTPEAVALIREFAARGEPEVAEEMAYRLRRLSA